MEVSEIGKGIAAARDVLVGLSAVSAAIFAYLGLNAWRKELKGKAEYELAKDVLKSVYRVREAFKLVRNPAIFQYEYPADMTDHHGHLEGNHDYEGTAHVYEKRWEKMDHAFRELEEHHLAAQVEWGSEFQDVIKKLRSCRADLLIAVQQLLERKKNPREAPRTTAGEKSEERSVLYHREAIRSTTRSLRKLMKPSLTLRSGLDPMSETRANKRLQIDCKSAIGVGFGVARFTQ